MVQVRIHLKSNILVFRSTRKEFKLISRRFEQNLKVLLLFLEVIES